MKKFLLSGLLAIITIFSNAQSVSINTDGTTAAASAMLDVKSTTKGMLIPRMTTVQRNSIPVPATGLLVYDTDQSKFFFYNGSAWTSTTFTLPYSHFSNDDGVLLQISNQGKGPAIAGTSVDGKGILAYSTNSWAIQAQSQNSNAIFATSQNSSAISATISELTNSNATIGVTNNGSGPAISAGSANNNGVMGAASKSGKAGIVGINTGTGYGVLASSSTGTALQVEGNLTIKGGNTNPSAGAVLTSDANGNATWKANRIAFRAKGIDQNWTTAPSSVYKLYFNTEEYDLGNGFQPASGLTPGASDGAFTAPVAGVFHFDAVVQVTLQSQQAFSATISIKMKRAGNTFTLASRNLQSGVVFNSSSSVSLWPSVSTDYSLMAGDLIWIELYQFNNSSANAFINSTNTYFNGHLVFAN